MLSPRDSQLLAALLELRADGPAIAVVWSHELSAGLALREWITKTHGFTALDLSADPGPLSPAEASRRRFIGDLPFLTADERRRHLTALNRSRDRIESLSLQLVLWMQHEDLPDLASHAPDLFAWVDELLEWRTQAALPFESPQHSPSALRPGPRREHSATLVTQPQRTQLDVHRLRRLEQDTNTLWRDNPGAPTASTASIGGSAPDASVPITPGDSVLLLRGLGGPKVPGIDAEIDSLAELLSDPDRNRATLTVAVDDATQVDRLERALRAHKPAIVHFCGSSEWPGGLNLRSDTGEPLVLHAQDAKRLFADGSSERVYACIVLNTPLSSSWAEALIEPPRVARAVVAVRGDLDDAVAVAFARRFHEALLERLDVVAAFAVAQRALPAGDGPHGYELLLAADLG